MAAFIINCLCRKGKLRYQKEYTLDYAQSQVTTDPIYGTRGGAILSLSDLLGDDNYLFLIYNTADQQSDFLKVLILPSSGLISVNVQITATAYFISAAGDMIYGIPMSFILKEASADSS
jgi:hypothetical protein